MKEIYVVTEGCYSDFHIEAVFSDRANAHKYAEASGGDVETWAIDERAEWVKRTQYRCSIALEDGWIDYESSEPVMAGQNDRARHPQFGSVKDRVGQWCPGVTVYSFVSAEHAQKLAVEARQARLRANLEEPS